MSNGKNGPSSSGRKPKYLYLDKFKRYVLRTDEMLSNLEDVQEKHTDEIRELKKKLSNQFRITIISVVINAIIGLTALILSLV